MQRRLPLAEPMPRMIPKQEVILNKKWQTVFLYT